MVQESKTYDILELNPQAFKEMKRIKGVPGVLLENEAMRNCRHSHDESTLPWIKGDGQLSLITMKDFSMKDIKNFFGKETENDVLPMLCVCTSNGDKAFGVSLLIDQVRVCYWEKGSVSKQVSVKEVFLRCRSL